MYLQLQASFLYLFFFNSSFSLSIITFRLLGIGCEMRCHARALLRPLAKASLFPFLPRLEEQISPLVHVGHAEAEHYVRDLMKAI